MKLCKKINYFLFFFQLHIIINLKNYARFIYVILLTFSHSPEVIAHVSRFILNALKSYNSLLIAFWVMVMVKFAFSRHAFIFRKLCVVFSLFHSYTISLSLSVSPFCMGRKNEKKIKDIETAQTSDILYTLFSSSFTSLSFYRCIYDCIQRFSA